jgi:hypothetical protein
MPGGNTQTDSILVRHSFGGVVLIEEDIFCKPVFEGCEAGASSYYFVNSCMVATNAAVCGFTWPYRDPDLLGPGYEYLVDSTAFSTLLIDFLLPMAADPTNLDVQYCDVLDPDAWYIAPGTGDKTGQAYTVSAPPISRNPFSEFIQIAPSSQNTASASLKVHDMLGRVVYQRMLGVEEQQNGLRIDTKNWKPGMYLILCGEGKNSEASKVIKR